MDSPSRPQVDVYLVANLISVPYVNQEECRRLLANEETRESSGELVGLEWPRESLDEIATESQTNGCTFSNNQCSCPGLSVEELRHIKSVQVEQSEGARKVFGRGKGGGQVPSESEQMREFKCKLTRRKLIKQMRKFMRSQSSWIMYELERLADEANVNLAATLADWADEQWHKLSVCMDQSDDETLPDHSVQWSGGLPIGARILEARGEDRRELTPSGDSQDSGVMSPPATAGSCDESLSSVDGAGGAVQLQLERIFKHRSSGQFRRIINYSCSLFARLLTSSALLNFDLSQEQQQPLSLHQLQLFACVECQKMRASLRFDWLAHCLWLAFDGCNELDLKRDHEEYLEALARLVGHLLRQHFLESALELWRSRVEQKLNESRRPSLLIAVELKAGELLGTSRPSELIKRTLESVVDELVAICTNLPRVECQQSSNANDELQLIKVLASGDDLLAREKRQLSQLVDSAAAARALTRNHDDDWIPEDYSAMIELINMFRASSPPVENVELSAGGGERARQLARARAKIQLLDSTDHKLKCSVRRHLDLGALVRLNLEPMARELELIISKERALLIRVHSDELFKLLDSLRLQLDELELNVDLSSALEDYLSKRWQIKQSQAPDLEQQILLGDEEDDDDGDDQELADLQSPRGLDEPEVGVEVADQVGVSDNQDDDELVNALVSNNNPNVAQLFALSNPSGTPIVSSGELGVGARGLAPLVESRLLLGRYEYLNEFLQLELSELEREWQFILNEGGLEFLTEYCCNTTQLEPGQLELISELAARVRELRQPLLSEALRRLDAAHAKLRQSHALRSHVLSKISLEFAALMSRLCARRLAEMHGGGGGAESVRNIKQLDQIQETASWAGRLAERLEFLACQNDLLKSEAQLLDKCCEFNFDELTAPRALTSDTNAYVAVELRAQLLANWRQLTQLEARFWKLVEQFETQQVKWLNSDSKKLHYGAVESTFRQEFCLKLTQLYDELRSTLGQDSSQILLENLHELRASFSEFEHQLLPIFKFLTNKHLTSDHWHRLNQLIAERQLNGQLVGADQQVYTTVAQLVDHVHEFVGELELISRQASMEHELSSLIETETRRFDRLACQSSAASQLESLEICARLDGWTELELEHALTRFLKSKIAANDWQCANSVEVGELARQLVACHATVKRYLKLSGNLNLMSAHEQEPQIVATDMKIAQISAPLVLRSNTLLRTSQQVRASLLLECARLFAHTWLESSARVERRLARVRAQLSSTEAHLGDIDELLASVRRLHEADLQAAGRASESELARLQRDSRRLELERELLASSESLVLERQRQALGARDSCVRQISERAIPAMRAATRALDCLGDGRSLRTLRSYRPRPPLAIRLVIEAVCLLRNCCNSSKPEVANNAQLTPERHFDALRGQIVEDYWPLAWRTLNGIHSTRFIEDLRQLNRRTIPRQVIRLIRRRYLSRAEFNISAIERISRETGLLARWLIAVDVFDRVLNIVRPNYEAYLSAESTLTQLMASLAHKRQQIQVLGHQLDQMQEQIARQVARRTQLIDLADDCQARAQRLRQTQEELSSRRAQLTASSGKLESQVGRLARQCLWKCARLVYLEPLRASVTGESRQIERILRQILLTHGEGRAAIRIEAS